MSSAAGVMGAWSIWCCVIELPARWSRCQAAGLFVLIGAEPFTVWLPEAVSRDRWGFILTGADVKERWMQDRAPFLLETSMPGVFAVGDVRHGSVKRVASAVGEGSMAIRMVHEYMAGEWARFPEIVQ